MVARMLAFRKNMLLVLSNSFGSHADFAQALKEGKGRSRLGGETALGGRGRFELPAHETSTALNCTSRCRHPAGFEACLNARADKPAELIARYLDSILRRGSKAGAQEGSLEDVLDAALALFRYVQVGGLPV